MNGRKFLYLVLCVALAVLPLAGCSGGGGIGSVSTGEKGTALTVQGSVDPGKSTAKTVGLPGDPLSGTVSVLNAVDATVLGTTTIAADGSFSGLSFTLPATKSIIIFRADTNKSVTPFYTIVPIDLSNPPAPGIGASNAIAILINQASTNTASVVSSALGFSGVLPSTTPVVASGMLGDTGNAIPAGQTYTTVAQLVTQYGGQVLAYNTSGLALTGSLNDSLLPAQDANTLTLDELNTMTMNGSITSVSIPGNSPIVSFQVTNAVTGKGIRGLKSFGLAIAQLKPAANGSPSEWLSYMIASSTSRPGTDTASNPTATPPVVGYTVIDNGDGSYTAKFARNIKAVTTVPYDANLTHRVAVQIRTTPSVVIQPNGSTLSNFYNEKILFKDFIPANPTAATMEQREITNTAACNECHTKIGVTTPHGGRGDVRYCMMCHTSQRGNGRTNSASTGGAFTGTTYIADGEVLGDIIPMIHKLHMGNRLTKAGYNYANVLFNNITYPQDITNCRKCHQGDTATQLTASPQADNWQTKPSRKACGTCHDNIDWATGANSKAGGAVHIASPNDSACASCHAPTSPYAPGKVHMTINPTPHNPNVADGLANFTYDINSVTVDGTNQAVIKFRILKYVSPALPSTATAITFDGAGANPLVGFTGGPSFLLAYALSAANQPFTASPDYNNAGVKAAQPISVSIANLLDGTKGTLVAGAGADAGYYIATIKGDKAPPTAGAYSFPVGATMRAVALQGYFTQISPAAARHAIAVQKAVTGDAVRRTVIDSAKCGNCHEWFEGHGGNRVYEVQVCVMCHVPNLSSSGKGANITTLPAALQTAITAAGYTGSDPSTYPEETNNMKDMIHGIHAGSSRAAPLKFVRDRAASSVYFTAETFVFPGILKRCDQCHTSTGYTSMPAGAQVTTDVTSDGTAITSANNVAAVAAARTSLPNANDLVTTPFTAACVSCHDLLSSKAHMQQNGGQIRVLRSAADPGKESCVTCHGSSGTASIFNAHRY